MATPLGHALAGLAIYGIACAPRGQVTLLLSCGFAAVAPDLDVIPGLVVGQPALYHHGITHSLGFAALVSLGLAGLCKFSGERFILALGLCFLSYSSHLLLDWLGPDGRPPLGIPVFWPIFDEHFISPVTVLLGMHHAASTSSSIREWLQGIFSIYNLIAILVEVLVVMAFLLFGGWTIWRRRSAELEERQGRIP